MDFAEYLRFFVALGFVLVLIAGLAALVRRSGFGGRLTVAPSAGSERRLALVEVRPLDAKRKLVLLRRDDREHLVLLGASGDLLIESGIPARENRQADAVPAPPGTATAPDNLVNRMIAKLRRQPS
ncbi:flagellar biosynthetic protein FliO [Pelagibius sp. 7325]|uniref:FliO/MopB family protein n=1 Tax=Pelagibius sp. 7325 TaxID=3131994 RepID=UPI0030ECCB52